MKIKELIIESEQIDSPEFYVRMLARLLKKEGVEVTLDKWYLWDILAVTFDAGPTVKFQATYDKTNTSRPWTVLRFEDNKMTSYKRRHYQNPRLLLDDVFNGVW